MLNHYRAVVGAEQIHGPPLLQALADSEKLLGLAKDASDQDAFLKSITHLLRTVTGELSTWKGALRPKATQDLERNCTELGRILSRCTREVEPLQQLRLFLVKIGDAEFLQEVGDTIYAEEQRSHLETAKQLLSNIVATPSVELVHELHLVLDKDPEVGNVLSSDLQGIYPALYRWLEEVPPHDVCSQALCKVLSHGTRQQDQQAWVAVAHAVSSVKDKAAACDPVPDNLQDAEVKLHAFRSGIQYGLDALYKAKCKDQDLNASLQRFKRKATECVHQHERVALGCYEFGAACMCPWGRTQIRCSTPACQPHGTRGTHTTLIRPAHVFIASCGTSVRNRGADRRGQPLAELFLCSMRARLQWPSGSPGPWQDKRFS